MQLHAIQALLIDIDDTILHFRTGPDGKPLVEPNTASLFATLQAAAVEQAGLSEEEAKTRIENIVKTVQWWRWVDFIVDLGLHPRDFWEFAYARETAYLQASSPNLRNAMERLQRGGFYLYITSNNPADGILHKLRLAGLGHIHGAPLFHQVLGPPELKALKWEPVFWQRALAHIGFSGDEVVVVGDNLRDDYEMPHSVGIAGSFLYKPDGQFTEPDSDSLIHVRSLTDVANRMLAARRKARRPRNSARRTRSSSTEVARARSGQSAKGSEPASQTPPPSNSRAAPNAGAANGSRPF